MSISNPQQNTNPCKRYYRWKGQEGKVVYYDKIEEQEFEQQLPFTFVVLDILATVTGYNDKDQAGIWANEVHNIMTEPMKVKTNIGREIAEGIYTNIKNTIKAEGGKFAASIYIGYRVDDQLKIGNLELKGASLSPWMELKDKIGTDIFEYSIKIADRQQAQKGNVTYYTPVFDVSQLADYTKQQAIELDQNHLQPYLQSKTNKDGQHQSDELEDHPHNIDTEIDQQSESNQESPKPTANTNTSEDEDVDSNTELDDKFDDIDDDLPF